MLLTDTIRPPPCRRENDEKRKKNEILACQALLPLGQPLAAQLWPRPGGKRPARHATFSPEPFLNSLNAPMKNLIELGNGTTRTNF